MAHAGSYSRCRAWSEGQGQGMGLVGWNGKPQKIFRLGLSPAPLEVSRMRGEGRVAHSWHPGEEGTPAARHLQGAEAETADSTRRGGVPGGQVTFPSGPPGGSSVRSTLSFDDWWLPLLTRSSLSPGPRLKRLKWVHRRKCPGMPVESGACTALCTAQRSSASGSGEEGPAQHRPGGWATCGTPVLAQSISWTTSLFLDM